MIAKNGVMIAVCALPVICAYLRLTGHGYVYSALTTLLCAAAVLIGGGKITGATVSLTFGLLLSAVGDYFLDHQQGSTLRFIIGVAFFLAGHIMFILYAAGMLRFSWAGMAAGFCVIAFYVVYASVRVLPGTPEPIRTAVAMYALISVVSLVCALLTRNYLWIIGIALLVFSDTMIAEGDFLRTPGASKLVHPTYYLSHIFMMLSAVLPSFMKRAG